MSDEFDWVVRAYVDEVRAEAARLVQRGEAPPWRAVELAHVIVQRRRHAATRARTEKETT